MVSLGKLTATKEQVCGKYKHHESRGNKMWRSTYPSTKQLHLYQEFSAATAHPDPKPTGYNIRLTRIMSLVSYVLIHTTRGTGDAKNP